MRPELGKIWAGCVDNHVYMIDIETGALLGDINVQRRIYDIDVTRDGSKVLISAGVNTAKHNLMLYTAEGEQLYNQQFPARRSKGCAFTADETGIALVNSRGELQRLDLEGNGPRRREGQLRADRDGADPDRAGRGASLPRHGRHLHRL